MADTFAERIEALLETITADELYQALDIAQLEYSVLMIENKIPATPEQSIEVLRVLYRLKCCFKKS